MDYWAIGILTYEMIVGSSPFADHQHGDQMTICRNIVEKKLRMPKAVPSVAGLLIRQLLHRWVARQHPHTHALAHDSAARDCGLAATSLYYPRSVVPRAGS